MSESSQDYSFVFKYYAFMIRSGDFIRPMGAPFIAQRGTSRDFPEYRNPNPISEKVKIITTPITGDIKDPLVIKVLRKEDPIFNQYVKELLEEKTTLEIQRLKRTKKATREAFQELNETVVQNYKGETLKGDLPLITAKALLEYSDTRTLGTGKEPSHEQRGLIDTVLKGTAELTGIVGKKDAEVVMDPRIDYISQKLKEDKSTKTEAVYRLTRDTTDNEASGLKETGYWVGGGIAAGILLENVLVPAIPAGFTRNLVKGGGLFSTGQADDIGGAIGTFRTERGGNKTWKEIRKENRITIGAILGAGVADLTLLPWLFDQSHHSAGLGLLAAGLFALTTYAGSLTGKLSNIQRSAHTIRELDNQGLLPGKEGNSHTLKFGEGFIRGIAQNQANEFRNGLLIGMGLSTLGAFGAQHLQILEGNQLSPLVQGILGPMETGTAFAYANGVAEAIHEHNPLKNLPLRRRLK